MVSGKLYSVDRCQRCGDPTNIVGLRIEIWGCRALCEPCYQGQRLARPAAARQHDVLSPERMRNPDAAAQRLAALVTRRRRAAHRCSKCGLVKMPKAFPRSINPYCWCKQCQRERTAAERALA
jgi:hypothetical protein